VSIANIRRGWIRKPLVVIYVPLYLTLMFVLSVLIALQEGVAYGFECAQDFLDDVTGPIPGAWRGRHGR
jgi:hypothetical protein